MAHSPSQLLLLEIMDNLLQLVIIHVRFRWIFRCAILGEAETEFYHACLISCYFIALWCDLFTDNSRSYYYDGGPAEDKDSLLECHVEDWKLHSRQPALLMWLVDDGIRDYISKKIRFAKILQKWDTSFMGSHRLRTILFWREIRYDTILTYFTVDKHHGGCSILVLYYWGFVFATFRFRLSLHLLLHFWKYWNTCTCTCLTLFLVLLSLMCYLLWLWFGSICICAIIGDI